MLPRLLTFCLMLFSLFTSLFSTEGTFLFFPSRNVPTHEISLKEFFFDDKWHLIDVEKNLFYLNLDNHTIAGYEDVADEPFLILRTKVTDLEDTYNFAQSCSHFANLNIFPQVFDSFEPEDNLSKTDKEIALFNTDLDKNVYRETSVSISNVKHHFDHITPYFELEYNEKVPEKIWWQIAFDKDFKFLIPNFQGIQKATDVIQFDACTDTFFNPQEIYHFRIKSFQEGQWSEWSSIFTFTVDKPKQIKNLVFEKLEANHYQISWEPSAEPSTNYLIFASNAFDFMPSIYTDQQYSEIEQNNKRSEQINNLITVTSKCSLDIGSDFAFYRIVAEKNGQYSVPSPIIHVYDEGLSILRSVLQYSQTTQKIERIAFPPAYAHLYEPNKFTTSILELGHQQYYTKPPHVVNSTWDSLQPFFLPENHPIKNKLDRLFSKRVTRDSETLRKAGFTNPDPMRFSKTIVSRNKNIPGYIFKLFSDDQKGISDSKCLSNRVIGSIFVQDALNRYNINHLFVVPKKWIYPLPAEPAPPNYLDRKNFIVVENELDIYTGKSNNNMWKSPIINQITLTWIYRLLQELGLNDSAVNFNMPITKDNRIAFIDTQQHHKWPVPFYKLWQYLSPGMGDFWNNLWQNGG